MIRITAVHMEGGLRHEHIASVRWIEDGTGKTDVRTRAVMVEWINGGGKAYVTDGTHTVYVGVVTDHTPNYIRTYADRVWTDNLLALPRF